MPKRHTPERCPAINAQNAGRCYADKDHRGGHDWRGAPVSPPEPRQQNPALKNITTHLGHDGAQALLRGLDHYLDSGGSLNQLAAFIYGQDMRTKDGHHTVRRTGTGLEIHTTETEPPPPTRCTWEGTDAEDPEGAQPRRCLLDQGHPTLNNDRPHLLERWHPEEPQPAPIRFTVGADETTTTCSECGRAAPIGEMSWVVGTSDFICTDECPDEDENHLRPHPTYFNCATCDGGGCGDCS